MDNLVGQRAFVIGDDFGPDTMESHVAAALGELGVPYETFECSLFRGASPTAGKILSKLTSLSLREPERLFEKRLIRHLAEFQPTLILVLLGSQLSPKTVARMRTVCKVPFVCWCQDQLSTMGRQYLLGSRYDVVYVKDRYLENLFSRLIRSTRFRYLPEACNPSVHKPASVSDAPREFHCDVMIAGTLYYYRQEILELLKGLKLKVWGTVPDWLVNRVAEFHGGRAVYNHEKALAIAAAGVCLNTLHLAEIDGVNCRAFEIAGCGGFQIMSHVDAVKELFKIDEEVVTFSTAEELVTKVHHYLANPSAAKAIGERGRKRAHSDHTYVRRLQTIFRDAGR